MKNTIKLNEAQLRNLVAESVKRVLRESSKEGLPSQNVYRQYATPSETTLRQVYYLYDYLYDACEESDATRELYDMITGWMNKQSMGEMDSAIGG